MTALLRTPLFNVYEKYGGKVVDYGGWELPVQFSGVADEHTAVRQKAGLFDVSHMSEFLVTGKDSFDYVQYIVTNDISKLVDGKILYSAMCYEDGGTVDDLLVYRKGAEEYLIVANASNEHKDEEWFRSHVDKFADVTVENISSQVAQLAIQGPVAQEIVQTLTETDLSEIKFFWFKDKVKIAGRSVLISRTGYTGEDGFEIYLANEDAIPLWDALIDAGKEKGLLPCGLGSRDTLRFEAGLPLYSQELTKDISPVQARIGFAVKPDKEGQSIAKEILLDQKTNGVERKIVGIEMKGAGIPRTNYEIFVGEKKIGHVTSGTQVPITKRNVGNALLDKGYWEVGTEVEVQIRKKRVLAQVVQLPFYKKS